MRSRAAFVAPHASGIGPGGSVSRRPVDVGSQPPPFLLLLQLLLLPLFPVFLFTRVIWSQFAGHGGTFPGLSPAAASQDLVPGVTRPLTGSTNLRRAWVLLKNIPPTRGGHKNNTNQQRALRAERTHELRLAASVMVI